MNFEEYKSYEVPFPVGVKLPEIKIEKKYYDEVEASQDESNYQFLRKLCFKKVKEKAIDKKDNPSVYYERLKEELDIFKVLHRE